MAGRGPAPKSRHQRERDTKRRTAPAFVLEQGDGQTYGPELPESMEWPAQTRRWWETWRSSPQAQALTDTDWDFLLDTALLHAELWSGNGSVASELRLRVAKFGATPEDRARLRMQIGEPDENQTPVKRQSRYSHLKVISEQS